ncbi:hypothetical protein BH10BAC6_BH10BAC6_03670 [soil metagenome]
MRFTQLLSMYICGLVLLTTTTVAQETGGTPEGPRKAEDTLIVFTSPRPLLENDGLDKPATKAFGLDLIFSNSGWAFGGFYQTRVAEDLTGFINLFFSPYRSTDELENRYLGNIPVVYGKLNRLFIVPLTIGLQYRLFSKGLSDSFRPFIGVGVGPSLIIQTPYITEGSNGIPYYHEFFSSFGDATIHGRLGGFVGIGANFGAITKGNMIGVNMRYYAIPFGGNGLESMQGIPISNFGGLFLSLTIGNQR